MREPLPPMEMPELSEFTAWAEIWLQDPGLALHDLKHRPASPFLFQALALHADPMLFGEHADKLISLDFSEVREPINLMFEQSIVTRRGLSLNQFEQLWVYDPSQVREICRSLPSDYRFKRIDQTRKSEGVAIDFWRRWEQQLQSR